MIVGLATGVELGDHDVKHLSSKQRHRRHPQRRSVDHGLPTFTPLVGRHAGRRFFNAH
jgi:hypothetical protein